MNRDPGKETEALKIYREALKTDRKTFEIYRQWGGYD